MVAFTTAMLLNTLSWMFELRAARRQLCFLAVYISGVAFTYEFLAWSRIAPIYVTASGRPISILRYCMWLHATPAMIYALSLISDFDGRRLTQTLAVDVIMLVTIIPGELVPAWHRWIWNAISCAVFPYLFMQLWDMYTSAIDEAGDDLAARSSLRALRGFTVTVWTVFPVIWAVVQLELVSLKTEEILWSFADVFGEWICRGCSAAGRVGASNVLRGNCIIVLKDDPLESVLSHTIKQIGMHCILYLSMD